MESAVKVKRLEGSVRSEPMVCRTPRKPRHIVSAEISAMRTANALQSLAQTKQEKENIVISKLAKLERLRIYAERVRLRTYRVNVVEREATELLASKVNTHVPRTCTLKERHRATLAALELRKN